MKSIKEIINESDSVCPYSNFSHPDCFKLELEKGEEYTVCSKPYSNIEIDNEKFSEYFALLDKTIYIIIHNDSKNIWTEPIKVEFKPCYCPKCGKNIFDQLKK